MVVPVVTPESSLTPGTESTFQSNSQVTALPSASVARLGSGSKSEAEAEANDVGTLQSRIHELIEENAVLADLAMRPPAESPPPAYA